MTSLPWFLNIALWFPSPEKRAGGKNQMRLLAAAAI